MRLIKDLPFWAKSLIAPAVALTAMLAMAATAFVSLANHETSVSSLDTVAFEGLRQSMVAIEAVTDFQTELYHLTSTAANEADQLKFDSTALRLTTRLDAIAPQVKAVAAREGITAIVDDFAGYDWSARQMIEFTRHDAAYGVMMMGYTEDFFEKLRDHLTETTVRA